MRNSFDVLKKAKKHDIKEQRIDDVIEKYIDHEFGRFKFIPSEAFGRLDHFEEYSHLKHGLYVAEKRVTPEYLDMFYDEWVQYKSGDYLRFRRWMDAKLFTQSAGGHMLTPAEYFCVLDHELIIEDYDFLDDFMIHGNECLDAILQPTKKISKEEREYKLHTHLLINGDGEMIESQSYEIPMNKTFMHYEGYAMDPRTGFPLKEVEGGSLRYEGPNSMKLKAIMRTGFGQDLDNHTFKLWGQAPNLGGYCNLARICFKGNDERMKKYEIKEKRMN